MGKLVACPFCREMFEESEAKLCPACGLTLADVAKLPPSYEAKLEEPFEDPPEWRTLPWLYWRRGRGVLVLLSLAGLAFFFLPWIDVTVPDTVQYSGFDMARRLGWPWACLVSWIMLAATVASRRCVARMRGARAATGLFAAIPMVSAAILFLTRPRSHLVPLRFEPGVGLYLTVIAAVIALPFAVSYGGRTDTAAQELKDR